jgi:myo-inositol 2-dehydrogenase/D-chiro-inositol 1-dehydrogenase
MLLGQLSLLEWVFGPMRHLYTLVAPSSRKGHEYALIAARMRSGAIAHVEAGRTEAAACGYFYYEIAGSQGLIEFDSRYEPEFAFHERQVSPGSAAGPAVALFPEMIPPDAWEREMADFIGAIREGRPARSGWPDALRALKLAEGAMQSARDNKVVELAGA